MSTPLRSLMVGDCDHYLSPYVFGVAQGMMRLGHWHSQINLRQPIEVIEQRVRDIKPDILWTHMLLWAPLGSPPVDQLVAVVARAVKHGAKVVVHDGDYKETARYPHDISSWCALVLCNHRFNRSVWKSPAIHWPYFAFAQDVIATAKEIDNRLFFAGTVRTGAVYAARTRLLESVSKLGVDLHVQTLSEGNTLLRTAEIAAGARGVLGFGRPGVTGWVDTRVFQYPGAGGILFHDDVGGYLEPWRHYVPYKSGDAASIVEAFERLTSLSAAEQRALREEAFSHVQAKHSSVARVQQVLATLGVA